MKIFKGERNFDRNEIDCIFCELAVLCDKTNSTGCVDVAKKLKIKQETIKDANFYIYLPTKKAKRRF